MAIGIADLVNAVSSAVEGHKEETLLTALAALLAALPMNRDAARMEGATMVVLSVLASPIAMANASCAASALLLLSLLSDNADLSVGDATAAAAVAVGMMRTFPEHREVLAAGASVIFTCSAAHADRCVEAGALDVLVAAAQQRHFANLEVGSRHPFRFKLGIVDAASRRLLKNKSSANLNQ